MEIFSSQAHNRLVVGQHLRQIQLQVTDWQLTNHNRGMTDKRT